jgi:hypothetical protein
MDGLATEFANPKRQLSAGPSQLEKTCTAREMQPANDRWQLLGANPYAVRRGEDFSFCRSFSLQADHGSPKQKKWK